ncbi:hypothetical protein [Nocardia sp. NPDC057227]|uniref:hypothetical protein n=1 Tax=Nocardia sp. NPDC057227 TaxID=3346056 RepID=UPI00363B38EE
MSAPNTPGERREVPVSGHSFPDGSRTTRQHAGEALEDTRNWPGMILVGLGIVLVGLTLVAAGYGFEGWAVIAGIACGVCLVVGVGLVVLEHRRVKALEGRSLTDPGGH